MNLGQSLTCFAFGGSIGLMAWTLYSLRRDFSPEGHESAIDEAWVRVLHLLVKPASEVLERLWQGSRWELVELVLGQFERKIRSAGLGEKLNACDLLLMIPASGFLGLCAGMFVYVCAPYWVLVVFFTVLGLILPVVWLRDRLLRRQMEIGESMPFAMDLLTLMTEAGLDFTIALERISGQLTRQNALGEELYLTQREIGMGKNRSQAMRNLAQRTDMFEVSAVCAAIIQADELGASFGQTLRIQSDQIRTIRAQQIEKRAMEAPVKILFPLIVFIFPTTFVVIFGPVFLSYAL